MGSVVSGITGFIGAKKQSKAAKQAAAAQQAAQQSAIEKVETTGERAAGLFDPYVTQGQDAGSALRYEMGLLGTAPTLEDGTQYQGIENTRPFQFALDKGTNALQNAYSGRGGVNSGAFLKDYGSYLGQQLYPQNLNYLSGLSNQGLAASGAQANALTGTGQTVANLLVGQGDSAAAGIIGSANAEAQGIQALGAIPSNLNNEVLSTTASLADSFSKVASGVSSFMSVGG